MFQPYLIKPGIMSNLIKIKKDEISSSLKKHYDIFICSSSFDDRCLSIAKSINDVKINEIIICHFENNYECANSNFEQLKGIFVNQKSNLDTIVFKKHDPLRNFDLLHSTFSTIKFPESPDILIDITSFTRENLLILLRYIQISFASSLNLVTLCYSPSSHYPNWLSKGVNQIRSILGYAGDFSPLKKLLLVVLTGFEYERSQILIDNYEPAKLLLGRATSKHSITEGLAEINEDHYKRLMMRNLFATEFEFSCIDINKTKEIILSIAKRYEEDYNVIIAPMNNKLSTLAVAFAAMENQNIQICYASTNQYNIEEKHGEADFFYCFELSDFIKT